MAPSRFSMKEAIRFGWDIVKNNFGFIMGLQLVAWAVYLVPRILGDALAEKYLVIAKVLRF